MRFRFYLALFFVIYLFQIQASSITEFTAGLIQSPHFEAGKKTTLPGHEIVRKVKPILTQHLVDTNYDRVGVGMQLIDYYQNQDCDLPQILSFKYKSELRNGRGAPCVGLTLDILSKIPDEVNAYIVAAILPNRYQQFAAPQYCHAAVLIAFESFEDPSDNGYILIDPSFDLAEPILLYRNSKSYIYNAGRKGIWVFSIDHDTIVCQIYPKGMLSAQITAEEAGQWRMIYRTDQLANPLESSAIPMALIDRRLSLLARDVDGYHTSHLNIELDKGQIVWDLHEKRQTPIHFNQFYNGSYEFDEEFASFLHMKSSDLNGDIMYILNHQNILNELYVQYLELIETTRDFSIVGNLDPVKLRAIIEKHRHAI